MRTVNTDFTSIKKLKKFCDKNVIKDSSNTLLQIFTSISDKKYIDDLIISIKEILPSIKIIGATSNGEILQDSVVSSATILSFSIFEKTSVKTYQGTSSSSSEKTVKNLIKSIKNIKEARVAIIFTNGLHVDSKHIIDLFNKIAPHITIAGGLAGDNGKSKEINVFTENLIADNMVSMAVLYGKELVINTSYNFGWENIGKEFKITKSDGSVVYEIDDIPAFELYEKYFGKGVDNQLTQFPLMLNRGGKMLARAPIKHNKDGSIEFAGDIKTGEIVNFGYGDIENILKDRYNGLKEFTQKPTETIFVYSCMTRKKILEDDIVNEFIPLSKVAPVSGFFTHGEFFNVKNGNSSRNYLFNQVTTLLSLSENSETKKSPNKEQNDISTQNTNTLKSFINLVNETTKELKESKNQMQKYIDLIDENVITLSIDLSGKIIDVSNALCKTSGYKKHELIKIKNTIFTHLDSPKSTIYNLLKCIKSNKTWNGELRNIKKNGQFFWTDTTISPMFDENRDKIGYTVICHDITNKKIIEELSITDGLTNIFNRRYFDTIFPRIIDNANRKDDLVSFLFIDIDYFKQYNDIYGHQEGDTVLVKVANCINSQLRRGGDYCFRLGGEEFGVILDANSKEQAVSICNKILQKVKKLKIIHQGSLVNKYVTVSIGLFSKHAKNLSADDIYKEADSLMYEAKKRGKNQLFSNI